MSCSLSNFRVTTWIALESSSRHAASYPDVDLAQPVEPSTALTPAPYFLICLDDDVHAHRPHFPPGMPPQIMLPGSPPAAPE